MASEDPVQETEGEFRNSKALFVKGVRMPHMYVYLTGFKDFIETFQTRQHDVFIVGFPRSGESKELVCEKRSQRIRPEIDLWYILSTLRAKGPSN